MNWRIVNGTVLRDGALRAEPVLRTQGQLIAAADDVGSAERQFDAGGLLVLPGIIDIHGDAHERHFQPRPGVTLPAPMALQECEAQILASGITTAFLGVTFSWEPGLRSVEAWRILSTALRQSAAERVCDLRVHLRFEVDHLNGVDEAVNAITAGHVDLLAFNDHTPSIHRKLGNPLSAAKYVDRAGVDWAVLKAMAEAVLEKRHSVEATRERLADAARRAAVPMASHDDASLADRQKGRSLGAHICEFPMTEDVALDARGAGEEVVMGAPNVVRGGSHLGWIGAAPLAERGLVTILASDYVWSSLMAAAFILADRGRMNLAQAWGLISANPARAAGLQDRGRIEAGLRGDLVLVDPVRKRLVATFCAGRLAWLSADGLGRLQA